MQTKLTQFFKKNTLDKSTTDFQKNETNIEQNNNIQKKTIQSDEFYILVKNRIDKTGAILKKSNQ